MKRLVRCVMVALLLVSGAGVARAQDALEEERARLRALLEEVDGALEELESLVHPKLVLRRYDVARLMSRPAIWAGPRLELAGEASGYETDSPSQAGVLSFDDSDEREDWGLGEGGLDPDSLQELVILGTGEEHWEGDEASVEVHRGMLIVRQSELVHARIAKLLEELRSGVLGLVWFEVGFYRLEGELRSAVEEAAREAKGVLSQELLARVDETPGALEQLGGLSAFSGQQVYLHEGVERAYIAGFEPVSGGTGMVVAEVADPSVAILRTGLVLELRGEVLDGEGVSVSTRLIKVDFEGFKERVAPWGAVELPEVASEALHVNATVSPGKGVLLASSTQGDIDRVIIVRPRVRR